MSFDVRAGESSAFMGCPVPGERNCWSASPARADDGRTQPLEGEELSTLRSPVASPGLALVPEDRLRDGLVQTCRSAKICRSPASPPSSSDLLLSGAQERSLISDSTATCASRRKAEAPRLDLCRGAMEQKVVIGKALARYPPQLLTVLDEPNRGIDVGAKAEIFRLFVKRAAQGLSLWRFQPPKSPEFLSIAHRIIVMRRGRISAQFSDLASPRRKSWPPRANRLSADHHERRSCERDRHQPHHEARATWRRWRQLRSGQIAARRTGVFALIAIIIVFSFLSPYYFTLNNFLTMATHVAIFGILAVGMPLVILNGGIDLSVGSTLALSASSRAS